MWMSFICKIVIQHFINFFIGFSSFFFSSFFSSYQTSFDSWNRQKCHLFNLNKIDILEIKYHAFLKNLYFFCWRLNVIKQSNILQESSHHPIFPCCNIPIIYFWWMCWFKFCLLPDSEPFQKPLGLQYRTRGWFRLTKNEQVHCHVTKHKCTYKP